MGESARRLLVRALKEEKEEWRESSTKSKSETSRVNQNKPELQRGCGQGRQRPRDHTDSHRHLPLLIEGEKGRRPGSGRDLIQDGRYDPRILNHGKNQNKEKSLGKA